MAPFTAGIIARFAAGLGMAVVGAASGNNALLGAAFMQLMYQSAPFVRIAQSGNAVRFANFPAGAANGWVIAASATGSFLGSLIGGFLADEFGLNAINWMAGIAAGGSVLVLLLWLAPASRKLDEPLEMDSAAHVPAIPPSQ